MAESPSPEEREEARRGEDLAADVRRWLKVKPLNERLGTGHVLGLLDEIDRLRAAIGAHREAIATCDPHIHARSGGLTDADSTLWATLPAPTPGEPT